MKSSPLNIDRYHPGLRLIHWLMAILIIAVIATGLMIEDKVTIAGEQAVFWHQSFGLTVFLLVWIRLVLRWSLYKPLPIRILKRWEQAISKLVHILFYILMIMLPISGYIMIVAFGGKPHWFGFNLPTLLLPESFQTAATAHVFMGFFMIILLGIHILAVVKHRLIAKVNLLQRM